MSYFDLLARFGAHDDRSALNLIRREWGYMLEPRAGDDVGVDRQRHRPARAPERLLDHGWSSGAAPALTSFVLGVRPTSPGFATFTVTPHPGNLAGRTATSRPRTGRSPSRGGCAAGSPWSR